MPQPLEKYGKFSNTNVHDPGMVCIDCIARGNILRWNSEPVCVAYNTKKEKNTEGDTQQNIK